MQQVRRKSPAIRFHESAAAAFFCGADQVGTWLHQMGDHSSTAVPAARWEPQILIQACDCTIRCWGTAHGSCQPDRTTCGYVQGLRPALAATQDTQVTCCHRIQATWIHTLRPCSCAGWLEHPAQPPCKAVLLQKTGLAATVVHQSQEPETQDDELARHARHVVQVHAGPGARPQCIPHPVQGARRLPHISDQPLGCLRASAGTLVHSSIGAGSVSRACGQLGGMADCRVSWAVSPCTSCVAGRQRRPCVGACPACAAWRRGACCAMLSRITSDRGDCMQALFVINNICTSERSPSYTFIFPIASVEIRSKHCK